MEPWSISFWLPLVFVISLAGIGVFAPLFRIYSDGRIEIQPYELWGIKGGMKVVV